MIVRLSMAGLAALFLIACASPPPKQDNSTLGDYEFTKQYLTWLIKSEMKANNVTGLSIALVDDQKLIWAKGFGYADLEKQISVTPQTNFQLGSIAKLLTATAAMQLVEQGRMDLDKPFKTYLPEFSIKSRFTGFAPITPRNIMTHHSGLPANLLKGMSVRNPEPFTKVVDAIKDEYVAFPPNYVFGYSNVGMTLMGSAIERISGEDYVTYVSKNLLAPMGMTNTFLSTGTTAKSYRDGSNLEVMPLRDIPSSGLVSNVLDMSRFMQMVFADGRSGANQILKPSTLAEMLRPQNEGVPLDLGYRMGLGWQLSGVDVENAGIVANHGGTTLNFQTLLVTVPKHKLGVVVLSNTAQSNSVVNHVAARALILALEEKAGIRQPQKKPELAADASLLKKETIDNYVAYYDTLVGLVKVSEKSGTLIAEAFGETFSLEPRVEGKFGLKYKLFGMIPISLDGLTDMDISLKQVAGREVLVGSSNNRQMLLGEKLKPVPIPPSFHHYLGEYEFVEKVEGVMPNKIYITLEDNLLVGTVAFPEKPGMLFRAAFIPVSDSEATLAGVGSGRGETLRLFQVGKERRLRFSGMEIRLKSEQLVSGAASQRFEKTGRY